MLGALAIVITVLSGLILVGVGVRALRRHRPQGLSSDAIRETGNLWLIIMPVIAVLLSAMLPAIARLRAWLGK